MKLAVIDHHGCLGGILRFYHALFIAVKKARPSIEITFFIRFSGESDGLLAQQKVMNDFVSHGIKVKRLKFSFLQDSKIPLVRPIARRIQSKASRFLDKWPVIISGAAHREVEKITKGFDLVYFTLWYGMICPQLGCPMLSTFHDFNFRYYFSGFPIFSS